MEKFVQIKDKETENKKFKVIAAVVRNDEGKILLVYRIKRNPGWAFPSGTGASAKFGQTPEEGVYDEVKVDTGLNIEDVKPLVRIPISDDKLVDETVAFSCKAKTTEEVRMYPKYVGDYAWVDLDDPRLDDLPFDQPKIIAAYREYLRQ